MTTLLQFLWPALLAAGLIGCSFAAVFGAGAGLPSARLEVRIGAALLLVAGVAAMVFELVPGRPGLWFDIGMLCALAYAAGVAIGALGRRAVTSRRKAEA
jgi:hypothetical protein